MVIALVAAKETGRWVEHLVVSFSQHLNELVNFRSASTAERSPSAIQARTARHHRLRLAFSCAVPNNLPSQRAAGGTNGSATAKPARATESIAGAAAAGAAGAAATRIAVHLTALPRPRPCRLVVGPHPAALVRWEDADRDLHDQLRLRPGRRWPVARRARPTADPRCLRTVRPRRPQRTLPAAPLESRDPRTSNQSGRTDQPSSSLSCPAWTPPAGRAADACRSAWQRTQRLT